jgi:hypothetical protein
MNQPIGPTTHELYGDTPEYKQAVDETFGGVTALHSPDMHDTLAHPPKDVHQDLMEREGADPFGYARDEALEGSEDGEA